MVTETYRGAVITLLEEENKWRFTANGRERTAPTLPKARESIDRALDAVNTKKEKAWEPFDVYANTSNYGVDYEVVKLTSVADTVGFDRTPDVWISGKAGRKKVSLRNTFALSDENAERVVKIQQLAKQVAGLNDEVKTLKASLTIAALPVANEK